MTIEEKAKNYAEGKVLDALTSTIEKAYADGYNAGYNDGLASKEGDKPDDLGDGVECVSLDDGIEYVDLGLPSGTKWASGYLKDKDNNIVYLPYLDAAKLRIPTKEQFEELLKFCDLDAKTKKYTNYSVVIGYTIIGPNGNGVTYWNDNILKSYTKNSQHTPKFWLADNEQEGSLKLTSDFSLSSKMGSQFMGHKLPVVLVRKP